MPPKRQRTITKRKSIVATDSSAHVHVVNHTGPRKHQPSSFEKAVHRVIDDPLAKGKYVQHTSLVMYQDVINAWSLYNADAGLAGLNSTLLTFFSPYQFKDAEGILFNGKTQSFRSWLADKTEGAAHNFPAQQVCTVNDSSATFRFKNVSQHKCVLEMYISYGRNGQGTNNFFTDWENSLNSGQQYSNVGHTVDYTTRSPFVTLSSVHPLHEVWKIQKVVFKFEPGEEAFYKLQGPKNYHMDGGKHITLNSDVGSDPTWFEPNTQGNGCYVGFRMLNDVTLVTGTGGDTDAALGKRMACAHPPNVTPTDTKAGGIVCEIKRYYNITAPMGVTVAERFAYKLSTNFVLPTGITDIQVDPDNPATIPSGPN